jgi:exopolysaccharide production protein ExoQ
MPPQIALLICIIFILYLFWADLKEIDGPSNALWIPLIWMFLSGSRYVSQWLELRSSFEPQARYLDGSPVDRAVFMILIVAGVCVLFRRRLKWTELFIKNNWIWLYFLFGLISIIWSDYPFVSFKRWVKALGNVVMALIILTEQRPYVAIGAILRRLAFLWVPLSVILIKYYPDLGRTYHRWSYEPMFIGVATQKNELGQICLISGIYFFWSLLLKKKEEVKRDRRQTFIVSIVFLSMIVWLLYLANSATSLACLISSTGILLISSQASMVKQPQRILTLVISAAAIFGVLDLLFGVKDIVIVMLGRSVDLTTRVPMWEGLLEMANNPVLGAGFESFWLGDRIKLLWEKYGPLIQAHNGYLEIYLNLGIIGLAILIGAILSGLFKIRKDLVNDYRNAMLIFCLIIVVAIYNWTEATFYGVSNMWLLLLLSIVKTPSGAYVKDTYAGLLKHFGKNNWKIRLKLRKQKFRIKELR